MSSAGAMNLVLEGSQRLAVQLAEAERVRLQQVN